MENMNIDYLLAYLGKLFEQFLQVWRPWYISGCSSILAHGDKPCSCIPVNRGQGDRSPLHRGQGHHFPVNGGQGHSASVIGGQGHGAPVKETERQSVNRGQGHGEPVDLCHRGRPDLGEGQGHVADLGKGHQRPVNV